MPGRHRLVMFLTALLAPSPLQQPPPRRAA